MLKSRKSSKPLNPYWQDIESLTLVTKSIDIKTPVENVFTYFARPEHVSDQIKNDSVGMTVVPMDIKDGMGVGTTFRVIGDLPSFEWSLKLFCRDFLVSDEFCCFTIPL